MRFFVIVLLLIIPACKTTEPSLKTIAGLRAITEAQVYKACMLAPGRYKYPVETVSDYYYLFRIGLRITPAPSMYCRMVSRTKR